MSTKQKIVHGRANYDKSIGAEYLISRAPGFLSDQAKRLGRCPFSLVNLHAMLHFICGLAWEGLASFTNK